MSPTKMQPMSYVDTICPWVVAFGLLKVRRNILFESKPPNTP
jgi:hypothetical protein